MIYAVSLVLMVVAGLFGIFLGVGYFQTPEFLSQRRMTTAVGTIILLFAFDCGSMWAYWGTQTPEQAAHLTGARLYPQVMAAYLHYKMRFPTELNDSVVIDDVQARDDFLIYKLAIVGTDSATFRAGVEDFENFIRENGCAVGEYYVMLKHGVSLEFDFSSAYGWTAPPLTLTPRACNLI